MDDLAEVYSLIICIDHVERAFHRDTIAADSYTETMTRLLSRYARLVQSSEIEPLFDSIERFSQHYQIEAKQGIERIKVGIPATAEAQSLPGASPQPQSLNQPNARALITVAENFVTFTDGVHLGYRSKADLHPLLADIAISLNKVNRGDFPGRQKIVEWLTKLNRLKTNEQLSDVEAAQCLQDVDEAYRSFQALL